MRGDARALLVQQHVPELARSLADLGRQVAEQAAAPGDAGAALRAESARAFDPERLFDAILTGVVAGWDNDRATGFRGFYMTPAGERILAAESAVLRSDPTELDAFLARQARVPAPEPRVRLAERLDRATGSSRLYAQAITSVRRRLRVTPADGAAAAAEEAALSARLGAESLQTALFAFRALGADDLSDYASFLEGGDAQWYFGTVNRAALAAVDAAAASVAGAVPH